MNGFLLGAVALVAATLALLMPPLLRKNARPARQERRASLNLALLREQMQELDIERSAGAIDDAAHAQARQELQQRVAEEVLPQDTPHAAGQTRWPGIVVGIAIPVVAAALYIAIGAPTALVPDEAVSHEASAQEVEAMVAGLARRLEQQPANVDGWHMLARSYNVLGRYGQASDAYARLVTLVPNDARLYADYADTLAMAQGKSLAGEPEKLIEQALKIEPTNLKALALSGSAAFEQGNFERAVAAWEKIMELAPADSDVARTTSDSLAHAKRLLAGQGGETAASPAKASAGAPSWVEGVVDIDPALRDRLAKTDTVFIMVKAVQGSQQPLAAIRTRVADLPFRFVFDDSMRMADGPAISQTPLLIVSAGVSGSGSADGLGSGPQARSDPFKPGSGGITLLIRPAAR